MKDMSNSLGGLGVSLVLVCGCLVLALVGELYYLLWWKKKRVAIRDEVEDGGEGNNRSYYEKGLFGFLCWKKPSSLRGRNTNNGLVEPSLTIQDLEMGESNNKEILLKEINNGGDQESVEAELIRLHNLAGPPRLLFTIKEETKEDLESEDGKSKAGDRSRKGSRTRSLSDLVLSLDTPFLTPLASPRLRYPNNLSSDSYHFNPLFEASVEAELNRLRSSPPPKFKFLRDAEEKLIRRLLEEAENKGSRNCGSKQEIEVKSIDSVVGNGAVTEGSFMGFMVGVKNQGGDNHQQPVQCFSTSSQVIPLSSSPTTLTPVAEQKP